MTGTAFFVKQMGGFRAGNKLEDLTYGFGRCRMSREPYAAIDALLGRVLSGDPDPSSSGVSGSTDGNVSC